MELKIKNRWTGKVQFTAAIECDDSTSMQVKIGLAVKWALKARANLAGADLADAYLAGAYLAGADLARANLAGANLAGAYLAGAYLAGADLADAYLAGANLAGADLARANLAGADLADAYLAGAYLAGADLARAYLAGANLARAYLAGANLARANLAGANLARAYLAGADLADAYLAGANLADAYLAGAYLAGADKEPLAIPVIPKIDAVILAAIEKGGTLNMDSWHGSAGWCGTTHCRAGWAVHCAGVPGRELEKKIGTQAAGAMIYRASRPGHAAPWFFAADDDALADIKKCAAEQEATT
jgi:uncharacterized protein YjbI with pentapeptide repeats